MYTSPLYHQGRVLVAQAGRKIGRLRCLDAATGELRAEVRDSDGESAAKLPTHKVTLTPGKISELGYKFKPYAAGVYNLVISLYREGRQTRRSCWPDRQGIFATDDPTAAPEGRSGGLLCVVSAVDGKKLAEHRLGSPPVIDGMAAAGDRLYLSTMDGRIV